MNRRDEIEDVFDDREMRRDDEGSARRSNWGATLMTVTDPAKSDDRRMTTPTATAWNATGEDAREGDATK